MLFGSPAILTHAGVRSAALRPRISTGLLFSEVIRQYELLLGGLIVVHFVGLVKRLQIGKFDDLKGVVAIVNKWPLTALQQQSSLVANDAPTCSRSRER